MWGMVWLFGGTAYGNPAASLSGRATVHSPRVFLMISSATFLGTSA
jgi:hypothetical protein